MDTVGCCSLSVEHSQLHLETEGCQHVWDSTSWERTRSATATECPWRSLSVPVGPQGPRCEDLWVSWLSTCPLALGALPVCLSH